MRASSTMWTAALANALGTLRCARPFGIRVLPLYSALVFLCAAPLLGCGGDDPTDPSQGNGDSIRLTPDLQSLTSEGYFIQGGSIFGRTMTLSVTYGGGCAEHSFRLYVSTVFMESDPVQTRAYLVHEGVDPCDSVLHEDLEFDLGLLVEEYRRVFGRTDPILINVYDREDAITEIQLRFDP